MKTTFVRLLLGSRGRLISALSGIVIGFATKKLAEQGLPLDPEWALLIAGGIAFLVMWVTDGIALKFQGEGVKQIQDALPPSIISDGVAGPKTIAAVEKAVSNQTPP